MMGDMMLSVGDMAQKMHFMSDYNKKHWVSPSLK